MAKPIQLTKQAEKTWRKFADATVRQAVAAQVLYEQGYVVTQGCVKDRGYKEWVLFTVHGGTTDKVRALSGRGLAQLVAAMLASAKVSE